MPQFFQMQDIGAIIPELEIAVFGMFLLIFDLLVKTKRRLGYVALAGIAISGIFLFQLRHVQYSAYGGSLILDPLAVFFKAIFLLAAALSIAISLRYLDIERENHGEYYALILFSTMGMMFMASAVDLVSLYIGLETMAIATYVLVGFLRSNQRSNEASMKYFLLGAFSSGILLYGMSLLYGIAGSTRFDDIAEALSRRPITDPISMMAMITLSAGMFFKIAAVPFHQWTPDAYEGAPTSITAFMSVAVKAASFAMMVRIFMVAIYPLRPQWVPIMAAVSGADDDDRKYCRNHAVQCEASAGIFVDLTCGLYPDWLHCRE
jgi:NADH-quinone oxidoreductase subunit N